MTTYVGFEIEIEVTQKFNPWPSIKKLGKKTEHITGLTGDCCEDYHQGRYQTMEGKWRLESDSSLIRGVEFISPPLPADTALEKLSVFFDHLKDSECTTTDRCGLHMNISSDNMDIKDIDRNAIIPGINYKLLYALWSNRMKGNEYLVSLKDILSNKNRYLTYYPQSLVEFNNYLLSDRYNFINLREFNQKKYFEIRIMGGKNYHKKFKAIESTVRHFKKVLTNAKKGVTKKQQKTLCSYMNRVAKPDNIFIPASCSDAVPLTRIKILQNSMANLRNIHKYDIKTLVKTLYKNRRFRICLRNNNTNRTNISIVHAYFIEYYKNVQRLKSCLNHKEVDKMLSQVYYNYLKFLYFKAGKRNGIVAIRNTFTYLPGAYTLFKIPEEESPKNILWVLDFIKNMPAVHKKTIIDNLSPSYLKFILKYKRKGMINFTKKALKKIKAA